MKEKLKKAWEILMLVLAVAVLLHAFFSIWE